MKVIVGNDVTAVKHADKFTRIFLIHHRQRINVFLCKFNTCLNWLKGMS
nr:hypothetical protein [Desulfobacter sp.]